jgi:regulator of sigma D
MPPVPLQLARCLTDNESILIERWRTQRHSLRKQLLKLMCNHLSSATLNDQEACLEKLCCDLINYISIGHGEIYDGLLRRQSRSTVELRTLTAYLYRCIGSSTDLVLDFNAYCERANIFVKSNEVVEALGKLTRSLLVRFAIEEQLLELTTE